MCSVMLQLETLLSNRKRENAERQSVLLAEIASMHESANLLLHGGSVITQMIDFQSGHRKRVDGLCADMRGVSEEAKKLSLRVKELDMVLRNLSLGKEFLGALDYLHNVDGRLGDCIKAGQLGPAVEIVERVHKYREQGFLDAKLPRFDQLCAQLCELVRGDLQEAVNTSDLTSVNKFAKMMSKLGLSDEALLLYTEYVRVGFNDQCSSHTARIVLSESSPMHVEAVTNIFLLVADVVQKNHEYIEHTFGEESFKKFLAEIEYCANAHAVRVIRMLMKHVSQLQHHDNKVDKIRLLDFCLEELVLVIMRCKRFAEYLGSLLVVPSGQPGSLQQVIEEVVSVYVAGEHALMRGLMDQAIADDCVDTDDEFSKTSSVVDDSFFIFKKSIDRSLLTSDPNCACAIVNNITTILQIEFREYLEEAFGNAKRLFNYCLTSLLRKDSALDHPMRAVFQQRKEELSGGPVTVTRMSSADSLPHAIGNISQASTYIVKFRQDCWERVPGPKFRECLTAFDMLASEFVELHAQAVKYLLQQLRTNYIAPFMSAVDNVNFDINETKYADMQVNDPYMRAFIASLNALVLWVKRVCIQESFGVFVSFLCDYISLRFEKYLLTRSPRFSALGAAQLYQDISRLVTFFAQNTEAPVRVKFGRLQELCSILCLESVDEYTSYAFTRVTSTEAKTILGLRKEFS